MRSPGSSVTNCEMSEISVGMLKMSCEVRDFCFTSPFSRSSIARSLPSMSVSTTGPIGANVSNALPWSRKPSAISLRCQSRALTSLAMV